VVQDRSGAGVQTTRNTRPSYVTADNIDQVRAAGQTDAVVYDPDSVILGDPTRWFDTRMFTLAPVGRLGNVGRNSLNGPGIVNWNFSLSKDTALPFLGETGTLQFRAEAFNLLNRANFGSVDPILFTGAPPPNPGRSSCLCESRSKQASCARLRLLPVFA
jgi:hypothetical protein